MRTGVALLVLLALPLAAFSFAVIGNTRPIGDGALFVGRVINPNVDLNSYRNCIADVGDAAAPLSQGGWQTSIPSIDMCCIDRGFLSGSGASAVCVYGCSPPNTPSRSSSFIAPYLANGAPCLANCIAIDGCGTCLPFGSTCTDHCQSKGFVGGRCVLPDTTDVNNCCQCYSSVP